MRDCLALLVAVCTLQSFIGRFSTVTGTGSQTNTLQIPSRTPGMTDDQYVEVVNNALRNIPGASFSFTRRPESGNVGNLGNVSPWGSQRSPTSSPNGYVDPRSQSYRPTSSPASSYITPPAVSSQQLSQNRYPVPGISGGRRPDPRLTSNSYLLPGGSGTLQSAYAASPVGNDNSYNGNRRGGWQGTSYNWQGNTPSGPGSLSTGSQPAPPLNPRRPMPLSSSSPTLWSPGLSSTAAGYNNGGTGNNYYSKPSPQPQAASDRKYDDKPVSPAIANQFGGRNGGVQAGVGGGQQQETSSQTTPVFDPKGGNDAASKVAVAIVNGLRNIWNTQGGLTGGEKLMMDTCEQVLANQQPAMKEMKKSDKTLLDVLPIWREKLIVELENFYQKEVRATEISRGSQHLNSMLWVFAECVRPKLVLMKV